MDAKAKLALGANEARNLRCVFALSANALSLTHYVDATVLEKLFEVVIDVYAVNYLDKKSFAKSRMENIAMVSLEKLMNTYELMHITH